MSGKSSRRPGERVFAAALLAFSLAAFWQAYGISGFQGLSTAGMFPMLASGAMAVSSLLVLLSTLRKPSSGESAGEALAHFLRAVTPARHVLLLALILAYVLVMPWIGFLIASGLFLFAAIHLLWRRGLAMSLLVTGLALASIHVIFRVVFQVVLPNGSLLRGMF